MNKKDYKEGYDQAIKDALDLINKANRMFRQQGSKSEAITCHYIFRHVEELLQCEMDVDERA